MSRLDWESAPPTVVIEKSDEKTDQSAAVKEGGWLQLVWINTGLLTFNLDYLDDLLWIFLLFCKRILFQDFVLLCKWRIICLLGEKHKKSTTLLTPCGFVSKPSTCDGCIVKYYKNRACQNKNKLDGQPSVSSQNERICHHVEFPHQKHRVLQGFCRPTQKFSPLVESADSLFQLIWPSIVDGTSRRHSTCDRGSIRSEKVYIWRQWSAWMTLNQHRT